MTRDTANITRFQSTPFCAKGDKSPSFGATAASDFNPRPSARRATPGTPPPNSGAVYFNPRPSARRATVQPPRCQMGRTISIHALLREGRQARQQYASGFQAISIHALLREGRPVARVDIRLRPAISIHALLREGRRQPGQFGSDRSGFQSTPFCAKGDILHAALNVGNADFNPRPSARRATVAVLASICMSEFQSTPFCAKGDGQSIN